MSPQNTKEDFFESGMAAFIKHDYERAISLFSKAIKQDDKRCSFWISRGAAYLQTDCVKEAIDDFSHAIAIRPNYARAFHMRALAFDKQGRTDLALGDLGNAIDLNPEYGAAYKSRAMVLNKIGRNAEALQDTQMATHLTDLRLAQFSAENNVWQSRHLTLEAEGFASEFDR